MGLAQSRVQKAKAGFAWPQHQPCRGWVGSVQSNALPEVLTVGPNCDHPGLHHSCGFGHAHRDNCKNLMRIIAWPSIDGNRAVEIIICMFCIICSVAWMLPKNNRLFWYFPWTLKLLGIGCTGFPMGVPRDLCESPWVGSRARSCPL